jgi:hypothetical protein
VLGDVKGEGGTAPPGSGAAFLWEGTLDGRAGLGDHVDLFTQLAAFCDCWSTFIRLVLPDVDPRRLLARSMAAEFILEMRAGAGRFSLSVESIGQRSLGLTIEARQSGPPTSRLRVTLVLRGDAANATSFTAEHRLALTPYQAAQTPGK